MRLLTAIAVSSFLFAGSASAATYYVSTTGNDAAAGSIEAPFRTLAKAAQVAKPGDVVNVRGGVYTGKTTIQSKGTAAAPIVFRAMAGETAVLDGTGTAAGTDVVTLAGTEYVDFSGFEVRNATKIGIVVWHGRNTRVLNNVVHDATRNGIYVGGDVAGANSDITISGNSVYNTVLENQYHTMNGGWAGAVVVSRTERATITGNRIWNNDGEGLISLRSNYATIRNNEIFDNYSVNLYLDNARFVTADGNMIYSTGNTRYFRNGKPAAGISVANETKDIMNPSSDNVFVNNVVVGTRYGFYYGNYESGGGLKNTKVVNNTFYGSIDEIIRVDNDAHANSLVANNIFFQTGSAAPRYSGAGPVVYRNNLWYGGSSGAAAGTGDLVGDPRFARPGGFKADDYRLTDLSPAIHTAVDLGDVTTDFFGSARTPTYDIGAHEQSLALGSSSPVRVMLEPPASLSASVQNGAIQLTWPAVQGVSGYRIYRNRVTVATVTATSWFDSEAAPFTAYTYAVTTIDGAGNESAPSVSATATAGAARDSQKPSTPGALTATADGSAVRLSWQQASDDRGVLGYVVYRNGVVAATVADTNWTDQSVAPSTAYRYDVVAFDAAQNYSAAATASVTTPAKGKKTRAAGR